VTDDTPNIAQCLGKTWSLKSKILHDYIDLKVALQTNTESRDVLSETKLCDYALVIEKIAAPTFNVLDLHMGSKRNTPRQL
jgi:hypothetical protein